MYVNNLLTQTKILIPVYFFLPNQHMESKKILDHGIDIIEKLCKQDIDNELQVQYLLIFSSSRSCLFYFSYAFFSLHFQVKSEEIFDKYLILKEEIEVNDRDIVLNCIQNKISDKIRKLSKIKKFNIEIFFIFFYMKNYRQSRVNLS